MNLRPTRDGYGSLCVLCPDWSAAHRLSACILDADPHANIVHDIDSPAIYCQRIDGDPVSLDEQPDLLSDACAKVNRERAIIEAADKLAEVCDPADLVDLVISDGWVGSEQLKALVLAARKATP